MATKDSKKLLIKKSPCHKFKSAQYPTTYIFVFGASSATYKSFLLSFELYGESGQRYTESEMTLSLMEHLQRWIAGQSYGLSILTP